LIGVDPQYPRHPRSINQYTTFDPAIANTTIEPEGFGHIHLPQFRDINRMSGDRKLIVIQPEAADLFTPLAPSRKFHSRLRIRLEK